MIGRPGETGVRGYRTVGGRGYVRVRGEAIYDWNHGGWLAGLLVRGYRTVGGRGYVRVRGEAIDDWNHGGGR
jgi:hypothetical protein